MITSNKGLRFMVGNRTRRRTLVAFYWSFIALACFAFLRHQERHGVVDLGMLFVLETVVVLPGLLGGVRGGGLVKPFRGVHWVPMLEQGDVQTLLKPAGTPAILEDVSLDERETRDRDHMHFIAYTVARWLALLLVVVYGTLGAFQVKWFGGVGPFFFFLITLTLWSLPQTLILRNEPDMEEPNES